MPTLPLLKETRQHAMFSQRMLAEKAGVTQVTIVRAEAGHEVTYKVTNALASALSVSPQKLAGIEEARS
jgi:DNA-binding XRE family transcriptional regulator